MNRFDPWDDCDDDCDAQGQHDYEQTLKSATVTKGSSQRLKVLLATKAIVPITVAEGGSVLAVDAKAWRRPNAK